MIKTNYHTHTSYCRHAGGSAADYAACAAAAGLTTLGISDHGPYPHHDFGLRMLVEELPDYLQELDELKEQYRGKMEILSGLEIEYLPRMNDWYQKLLTEYHLDYLVLGEHFFEKPDGSLFNIYNASSTEDYLDYAKSLCDGMRSGYYAIAAHPDLMFMHDFPWDENCEKASDMIISTAKELDFILEFNANGYRRGFHDFCDGGRYQYPHPRFWKKVADAGLRVIINADAHDPEQVWDWAMEKAWEESAALGLHVITDFR